MREWEMLPEDMKCSEVEYYYKILSGKQKSITAKRFFDVAVSGLLLLFLGPIFIVLSIIIKFDSTGPVMFRQTRVTQYGRVFKIFKFRTMVNDAEKLGGQVTTNGDKRITKVGTVLRKYRLDELPQLINILLGDMTFVGTRPEVVKYVKKYNNEMKATLLMPAGVTSRASILYKDEEKLLESGEDPDSVYLNQVLPEKMKYNLESLEKFSFFDDLKTMIMTVIEVVR